MAVPLADRNSPREVKEALTGVHFRNAKIGGVARFCAHAKAFGDAKD
jgi:hypothetical protein